jgi:hypothetical protein
MSEFYDDLAAMADEQLAEFGRACTLGVLVSGSYDPAEGAATITTTDYPITATLFDYPQKFIDGSLVLTGDKKALVSARGLAIELKPGHVLTDSLGVVYTVVNVKATAPAGTVVLWTLQVRK